MQPKAYAPGIYPRSEALVQATRDLDRGRTTQEAVDEQVERDLAELVSVQQQAGLDLLADGMLRWQDLFRPLLEATDGLETGALTRFLDTNTFYRAPHATTATPKLEEPLGEHYVAPLPGPRLVTLPSPFALAHGTDVTPQAIAENVLRPAIDALDADLVVLAEPFFGRDDASPAELEPAFSSAISGACRARTPISPAAPGTITISASSSKTAPSGVVSEIANLCAPSAKTTGYAGTASGSASGSPACSRAFATASSIVPTM